jgi:preprotein translocase subunit SecG
LTPWPVTISIIILTTIITTTSIVIIVNVLLSPETRVQVMIHDWRAFGGGSGQLTSPETSPGVQWSSSLVMS